MIMNYRNVLIIIILIFLSVSCDKTETRSYTTGDSASQNMSINRLPNDSVLIIGSQYNPYNDVGMAYFRKLELLSDTIDKGYLLSQDEKESYIENNFIGNLCLTESDIELFKIFFANVDFNYINIIIFEEQILQMENSSDNVLLALSYLKYSYAYAISCEPGGGGGNFSFCLDNCIKRKLQEIEDANWIEKSAFVISCVPSFALIVASCTWECS